MNLQNIHCSELSIHYSEDSWSVPPDCECSSLLHENHLTPRQIFGGNIYCRKEDLLWVIANAATECRNVYSVTRKQLLIPPLSNHSPGQPALSRGCSPTVLRRGSPTRGLWGIKRIQQKDWQLCWELCTLWGRTLGQASPQEPRAAGMMPPISSCE